ncbi:SDR family NAD(P)-dependent oxidoreductase [Limnochorda sp.]|uniref:SDR family NAD(P)-dependent oxidoreductase n=1 Tax=Limnochorda sp. TaxID=1940279 RepID=UPI0017D8AAF5|nr:SDR family oxidoreductase [Bacillota bacterium]
MERSRVWLVTGASRGLGLALAREVARRGEGLVICARGAEGLAQAAAQLRALGASVHARAGDVADRDLARRLVAEGTERFGRIDVLVNNASLLGPSPLPPLAQYPLAQLEEVFAANVFGPLALIQAVLIGMLARGHGLIVNISSDAAVGGYPGWGGYGASKAALDLITHTLANELAGTGVGAVAIDPGDMRTQMHQAAFPGEDISDRPLPEEVAPAVLEIIDRELARAGRAGNASANGAEGSYPARPWRFLAQGVVHP